MHVFYVEALAMTDMDMELLLGDFFIISPMDIKVYPYMMQISIQSHITQWLGSSSVLVQCIYATHSILESHRR